MSKNSILISLISAILLAGCKILPSSKVNIESQWKTYEQVSHSYDQITLGETTLDGLQKLGFHPSVTNNVKILNYLDIISIFMPRDNIQVPAKVKECIDAQNECYAYQITLESIHQERYGNALLDVLGFRKNTMTDGWRFEATILIKDEKAIYKIKNSTPKLLSKEEKKIPLGPFQSSETIIREVIH
jgi:hypothetical protein